MAEGGTLAWKRQVIDESRGPAGRYDSMKLPTELPDGVAWKQNLETREWTLVRIDHPERQRLTLQQQRLKYKLQRTMAWNPHTGREQYSIKLKPTSANGRSSNNGSTKKNIGKTLDGGGDDEETVATATDTVTTNATTNNKNIPNDLELLYFNEDYEEQVQEQLDAIKLDNVKDSDNEQTMPDPPILGKDYVVHTILSSDTFQGLLLRYKIKAIELRRINQFSGTNLSLAPSHLIIPLTKNRSLDQIRLQDTTSQEYKMQIILTEYPQLNALERKAYLEMNDWDINTTLEDIRKDLNWEEEQEVLTSKAAETKLKDIKIPTPSSVVVDENDDAMSLSTPLLTSASSMKPLEVEEL